MYRSKSIEEEPSLIDMQKKWNHGLIPDYYPTSLYCVLVQNVV